MALPCSRDVNPYTPSRAKSLSSSNLWRTEHREGVILKQAPYQNPPIHSVFSKEKALFYVKKTYNYGYSQ